LAARLCKTGLRVNNAICLLVSLFLIGCVDHPGSNDLVVFSGATMGTVYSIKVHGIPEDLTTVQLQSEIKKVLEQISHSMSTFQPESEVSRFNSLQRTTPFSISSDLFEVLAESLRISMLTNGALDITVAPLVNLWGFGVDSRPDDVPGESQINSLLKRTGYKKIKITDDPATVLKQLPELTVNLSAIAKGYAVDQVSLLLAERGITGYLVEIGGEIRTSGQKPGQMPWIVGIEKPAVGERTIQQVVSIGENAMATSGDYRNYFEKNGKRYSHLIDPTTGRPVEHQLASVSVIHPSCMTADGFATAFMVMGPDKAYRLAIQQKLAAYFLVRTRSGFDIKTTPAFQLFLVKN